jgi:ATP synthase I chain
VALDAAYYRSAQRRIEGWTLGLGALISVAAAMRVSGRAGAGVAAGTALAWLNFRWLKKGIAVLEAHSTQPSLQMTRVPRSVYVRFFGGYALLLAVLYAIFFYSLLPAQAVLVGLFTLVGGIVIEGVYQLLNGPRQKS